MPMLENETKSKIDLISKWDSKQTKSNETSFELVLKEVDCVSRFDEFLFKIEFHVSVSDSFFPLLVSLSRSHTRRA